MQENEFEKQIKDAMDELHVQPSESVWENVREHLIKRKRRVLPFFLLFGFIALGGGYFMYSFEKNNHSINNKNKIATTNISTQGDVVKNEQEKNLQQKESVTQNQTTDKISTENKISASALQNVLTTESLKNKIASSGSNDRIDIKTNKATNNNVNIIQSNANNNFNSKNQKPEGIKKGVQPNLNTTLSNNTDTLSRSNNDSITKKINTTNKSLAITQKKSAIQKNNKQSKWKFGLTAMYGISNISSFANFNSEKYLSNSNAGAVLLQGISTPQWGHSYNSSEAYKFGVAVQRKLFGKSFLNTGINYIHLSAKSIVATSSNSSFVLVAPSYQNSFTLNYYQLGTQAIFKSKYDFIELPVTFQSNLFKIKTFSISYKAGSSVRELISSTPLIYNDNNNTFSKNENLLNHTQFQLLAGLSFQLKLKNNNLLSLSPQFEYSVSKYAQNNNFHYFDYGLQATLLLGKK